MGYQPGGTYHQAEYQTLLDLGFSDAIARQHMRSVGWNPPPPAERIVAPVGEPYRPGQAVPYGHQPGGVPSAYVLAGDRGAGGGGGGGGIVGTTGTTQATSQEGGAGGRSSIALMELMQATEARLASHAANEARTRVASDRGATEPDGPGRQDGADQDEVRPGEHDGAVV